MLKFGLVLVRKVNGYYLYNIDPDTDRKKLMDYLKSMGVTLYSVTSWVMSEDEPTHSIDTLWQEHNIYRNGRLTYTHLKVDRELKDTVGVTFRDTFVIAGRRIWQYTVAPHTSNQIVKSLMDNAGVEQYNVSYNRYNENSYPGYITIPYNNQRLTSFDNAKELFLITDTPILPNGPLELLEKQVNGFFKYQCKDRVKWKDIQPILKNAGVTRWNNTVYNTYSHQLGVYAPSWVDDTDFSGRFITVDRELNLTTTPETKTDTGLKGKFIIWSPQSDLPPKKVHGTEEAAKTVCHKMAEQHPNQEFYCVRIDGGFKSSTEVVDL